MRRRESVRLQGNEPESRLTRAALRTLLIAAAAGTLAAGAGAQHGLAGSPSHVSLLRTAVGAGGLASGASSTADVNVGDPGWGGTAASQNFMAHGGAVLFPAALAAGPPLVFGVLPGSGDKGGGDATQVVGFNFAAPGSGATAVTFAGAVASNVSVAGNTVVNATTPPGLNAHGNPLGPIDVEVVNQLGSAQLEQGFVYLPAVAQRSAASVGGEVEIEVLTLPGDLFVLAVGRTLPGVGIPIWPFDGALEVVLGTTSLTGMLPNPTGASLLAFPIPDKPALAGASFDLQAVAISSLAPLAGSFSAVSQLVIDL